MSDRPVTRLNPAVAVGLALVFAIPCAAFAILCLRHFYILGGFWGDSGSIAAVLWHNDLTLRAPLVHGGGSFLSTHTSLTLLPITWVSWAVPLTRVQFFAAFTGVIHALLAVAVYWVLVSCYRMRGRFAVAAAAVVALMFGFNGLAIAIARNPHYELLFSVTAIFFLIGLILDRPVTMMVCFIACLGTREDSGFHLFGFLAVLAAIERWHGVPLAAQRRVLILAAIALLSGLVSVLAQRLAFADGGHSLGGVYIGDPPFAGITTALLLERLAFWYLYRPYLVLPAVGAAIWAVRSRSLYPIAGYLAFVPWAVLHLFAKSELAGTLSNYYPFPFIVAAFWPLLGAVLSRRRLGTAAPGPRTAAAFALLTLSSFIGIDRQHNPGRLDLPESFLEAPSRDLQHHTDQALALIAGSGALGQVAVDAGTASLLPDQYSPSQTITLWPGPVPDTVIYFVRGFEAERAIAMARDAGLDRHFAVPATAIRVATNRPLDGLAGLVRDADWR